VSPLPPGPSAAPAVQTLRWVLRPIAFLEAARREFGDAFSVRFTGFESPMVMLSHPDAVRALYTGRDHGLPPGRTFALRPLLGERSVLLLEGREHLDRRRLMLPAFHGERLRAYEALVREATEREIATWPVGRPFAVHPGMQAITLEVILSAVFGVTDPARRERLRGLLIGLLDGTGRPGLQLGVLLARRFGREGPLARIAALREGVDAVLAEEIAERRADRQVERREDILSQLVAARFEDGGAMDDGELRDQLITLLVAGHETTATALAWTFDLLVRHPAVLRRLLDELGAGDERYVRAVVSEALRLRPVVPLAGRRLGSELRAGDLVLPAGTDVTPAIWLTNTRAESYPEPYAFRPERFLEQAPGTYAWIPFGGGSRRCLGAAFAELEMRVVLATVLERLTVKAAGPRPEHAARRNVTLAPRHGTRLVVRARPGTGARAAGAAQPAAWAHT
jgi:cytochrome P450